MDKNGILRCGVVQMLSIKVPLSISIAGLQCYNILSTIIPGLQGYVKIYGNIEKVWI